MVYPDSLKDREQAKFVNAAGETAIRVSPKIGFDISSYDYISIGYPSNTTETFTYKNGGSSGTTVATITITYVDSTKAQVSSVAKA